MHAPNRRLLPAVCGLVLMVVFGGSSSAQDKAAPGKTASENAASVQPEAQKHVGAESAAEKHEAAPVAAGSAGAASAHGPGAAAEGGGHAPAHGGHHDETDLSHQDSTAGLTSALDWRRDAAIATLLIFLCLLALLSKFAWRPILAGLEAREQSIAAKIDEANRSAEKAAAQLRQYEARLAAATEESRGILDQARRDAESAKTRIVTEAQEVAQRERQRAVDDIAAAKNLALQEMTQKSVDLAVSLAGRLIRKQLRPEDHAQLIREMVDKFPSQN